MFFLVFFLSLGARHAPQVAADLRNSARGANVYVKIPVKAYHVALIWGIVLTCAIVGAYDAVSIRSWLGLSLLVSGNILGLVSLHGLGKSYSEELVIYGDSQLVCSGVYSVIRHPLRLALSIETFGALIVAGLPGLLILWTILVATQIYRTLEEDRMMRDYYGKPAIEYQSSVPAINFFRALAVRNRPSLDKTREAARQR